MTLDCLLFLLSIPLHISSPISHYFLTYLIEASCHCHFLYTVYLILTLTSFTEQITLNFSYMPCTIQDVGSKQNKCIPSLLGVCSSVGSQTQLKIQALPFTYPSICPWKLLFLPPLISSFSYFLWYLLFISAHFTFIHFPYFICFVLFCITS